MKATARVFWTIVWLGALMIGGAVVLSLTASRIGQHKSSTFGEAYGRFQQSWGGEIGIQPPGFALERTWTERVYNSISKQYDLQERSEKSPLVPEEIRIVAAVDYGEQKRGLLTFNAFEVHTMETYRIPNRTEYAGRLLLDLAMPQNANYIYDFTIQGPDQERSLLPDIGSQVEAVRTLRPGETADVQVSYTTKGMDVLRYSLSSYQNSVVDQLNAELRLNTREFQIYRFGMPHEIESTPEGAVVRFAMRDFSTTQDLGIAFDSKAAYLDQIQSLLDYSPIALILWIVVLFVFTQIKGTRFNGLHYLFLGALHVFYFLFVAYLIRFFGVWLTFGLATALTAVMFFVYCPNVLGRRFAYRIAGLYLFLLTVLFSLVFLMPIFRGLLFVTLCFLIFVSVMIALSRSEISAWPILQTARAGESKTAGDAD